MVAWEALDALSHQLELCKINADTRVVVVLEATIDADRAGLIRAAVARSGAEAIEVKIIDTQVRHEGNGLLAAAADAADVLIVTSRELLDRIDEGTYQTLELPAIAPDAFPPHANLMRRVHKLAELVESANLADSANLLRISDSNGTNLRVDLAGGITRFDHGVLSPDRVLARFPAGWVAVVPNQTTTNGELVLMPGDGNRDAKRLINSPVLLRIIDDHISAIEGDSADADVIRSQLEYPADPASYGVAEIVIGMNPGVTATGPFDDRLLDPVAGRLLAGVVGIAFGENLIADRPCTQQIDFALRGRTVDIDDLPIVVNGSLDGDFAPDVYEL